VDDKIRSVLVEKDRDLRAKYEQIYQSSGTWLYPKSHGVHSTIVNLIRTELPQRAVLDLGCGAGRLSLMCSHLGADVDAVDFSESAIALARLAAATTGNDSVRFAVEAADAFTPRRPYDVILLVGVLEHVPDPVRTLGHLRSCLTDRGRLVVSCPNFINLRGYAYMPLLTLCGLPMSLADLRQVSYRDIDAWAAATGLRRARTAGAIYRFAWGRKGVDDLISRVPRAARDRGAAAEALDLPAFNAWISGQAEAGEWLLGALESRALLRRIVRPVTFEPRAVDGVPADLAARLCEYVNEDVEADPFWCDEEPFCYYGGEAIYVLDRA
jgi:2-polyprenyl-3-methyl-5-hydroxy-6-metoxy-1,4-benzoquinol methylase